MAGTLVLFMAAIAAVGAQSPQASAKETKTLNLSAYAELQGLAASLYGLNAAEFTHLLGTFPLVDRDVRDASLLALRRLMDAV